MNRINSIRQLRFLVTFSVGICWVSLGLRHDASALSEAAPQIQIKQKKASGAVRERELSTLPIGIFDSGTGGLTVLEQILKIDVADNDTHEVSKADGRPDFQDEKFIFLADQANMPYGNYPVVGKKRFLTELIVRDAKFLLGNEFYPTAAAAKPEPTKSSVKAIVIACNTATAYGKKAIEQLLSKSGTDVRVIGVIQAGAQGALEDFPSDGHGTIGVMATMGTVLSGAYPAAIRRLAEEKGMASKLNVVQQGAFGLAGAIDASPDFINRRVDSSRTRKGYKGPSLDNPEVPIDPAILKRYDFDFDENAILFEGDPAEPSAIQLNSVDNYIAYHVVSLMEKLRRSQNPQLLSAVILGCTHFPYYSDVLERELTRLYNYKEDGEFIYRRLMVKKVRQVDPAYFAAKTLHQVLALDSRFAQGGSPSGQGTRAEFFLSVPSKNGPAVELNSDGGFAYDYKYGREPADAWADVRAVPLGPSNVSPTVMKRLTQRVPLSWQLYQEFRANSEKVANPLVQPSRN